ncbi:reverse transcriptase domain-containing protein [Tanacetum coccineum]
MTRMMYNWIMRRKLNHREDANEGISNFTGRIKGMHAFIGNFTYVVDFMIVEDISSIINPRLSQVVLGRPFIEISNMTHDLPEGVVRPAETDIRLSLASHSYIYPLGIAEDVLVEVAEHVYPIDFVILDIKENEKRPFILETPFLTTAKAKIKFDKGTITLRSGKSKISFHRVPNSPGMTEKGVKNDIEPIAPTMTMNRLVLEWEEKLHLEREMEFNQQRSKNFKGKHPTLITTKGGIKDKREVM